MSSLDDVYERLKEFRRALGDFREACRDSMGKVRDQHDVVAPLWQDRVRQQYEARWIPHEEALDRFLNRSAPACEEFVDQKIRALGAYLDDF